MPTKISSCSAHLEIHTVKQLIYLHINPTQGLLIVDIGGWRRRGCLLFKPIRRRDCTRLFGCRFGRFACDILLLLLLLCGFLDFWKLWQRLENWSLDCGRARFTTCQTDDGLALWTDWSNVRRQMGEVRFKVGLDLLVCLPDKQRVVQEEEVN